MNQIIMNTINGAKYQRIYNMIHDTDNDIDSPFVKESEDESNVSEAQ